MQYKDSQTKKSARTKRSKQIATPAADLLSDLVQETGRVFDLTDRNKFQRECDAKIVAQHFECDVGIIKERNFVHPIGVCRTNELFKDCVDLRLDPSAERITMMLWKMRDDRQYPCDQSVSSFDHFDTTFGDQRF